MTPDEVKSIKYFTAQTADAAQVIDALGVVVARFEPGQLSTEERAVLEAVTTTLEGFERALAVMRAGFARLLPDPDRLLEN
ncbi:MAG: hypothetical protein EPN53_01000 [Acidobacteria bacterium]|nr:MAG: hypothetical protein EPN53_01000 [Acidobacteriota bacterium]